jgi:hypothetical protein
MAALCALSTQFYDLRTSLAQLVKGVV